MEGVGKLGLCAVQPAATNLTLLGRTDVAIP